LDGSLIGERKFYLLLLVWGLCLVLFLWTLSPLLSPLLLFFLLVYLLSPFYGTKVYGRIVLSLGFLTALWLVRSLGWILTPFVLAFVLAYILNPVVNRVQSRGLGRSAATGIVLGTFLTLTVVAVVVLGPVLSAQIGNFVSKLPELLTGAIAWARSLLDRVSHVPIPGVGRTELGDLLNIDTTDLGPFLQSRQEELRRYLLTGAAGVGKGIGIALQVVSYMLVTPIMTFFVLRDFAAILHAAGRLVPVPQRPAAARFFREFDVLLGKFLRSQLLVSIIVGFIIGIGFALVGFPYALLLGVIAGVFNIVPFLGMVVTVTPAVLIALVSGNVAVDLAKVVGVFAVEQVLENIISPRIVGKSVGLHPIWVMLSIVFFAFFFGPIGLLIAVPMAVAIKLMLANLLSFYASSTYYRGAEPAADGLAGASPIPLDEPSPAAARMGGGPS
jgi:predicted PurR-regulated permease PerM